MLCVIWDGSIKPQLLQVDMWNTGCAEVVLQLETVSMICRMFSDVWKPSERIQIVLNCPGENVTIIEIPSVYNSQHTLKLFRRSLNQGWCYSLCFSDSWPSLGILWSRSCWRVHGGNTWYISLYNCCLLAVMIWTKWDDGAEVKSHPGLQLPLKFYAASSHPEVGVHRKCKAQLNS